MDEETARIKCKSCKRDGMPPDEEECRMCNETRQLYDIRKELAEWHDERYMGERLDRFEFDDEVFDKWPYLKDRSVDGMWYLDHTIKRNLDRILRHRMSDYQESKDGRILINLTGISRFKILKEISNNKLYREFEVDYKNFIEDINPSYQEINTRKLMTMSKTFFEFFV